MTSTPSEPPKSAALPAIVAFTPLTSTAPIHDELAPAEVFEGEEKIDVSNFYILGDPKADRDRLLAQAGVLSNYVRFNASRLLKIIPKNMLDIGCGEGQMSLALGKAFPDGHIIGVDQDPVGIQKAMDRRRLIPGIKMQNIEFTVGNVQEALPPGPFDLIYASAILLHLADPEKTLKMCFERLRPGGLLWIREAGDKLDTSKRPAQQRWMELMTAAMAKMQRRFYIAQELPELLPRLGFENVREITEQYNLDENSMTGRIMLSVVIAGAYNMIPMIEKIQKTPHEELITLHRELTEQLQRIPMVMHWPNFIAQKPIQN